MFAPGDPRINRNGRPKGSVSHSTQELRRKAEELGCDPFTILCMFALGDAKALGYKPIGKDADGKDIYIPIDAKLRQKSAADAAQYVYHKLKQVEVSTPAGGALDQLLAMPEEERKRRLAHLAAAVFGVSPSSPETPVSDRSPETSVSDKETDDPSKKSPETGEG